MRVSVRVNAPVPHIKNLVYQIATIHIPFEVTSFIDKLFVRIADKDMEFKMWNAEDSKLARMLLNQQLSSVNIPLSLNKKENTIELITDINKFKYGY